MAEEDLIFGQKRHLFGGIAPGNMRKFEYRGDTLQLIAVLPNDTVLDGQVICSVAGAVIRRKHNGYPINEFDGEKVADISTSQIIKIPDFASNMDEAWYYSAFPYSSQGVYNRNSENRCVDIGVDVSSLPYGYDIDLNDIDPITRVTYPPEVCNHGWEPAIDLNNIGQHWREVSYMPCTGVMNSDTNTFITAGEEISKLDKLSYPKFNFVMQWGLLYVKRTVEDNVYKFRIFAEPEYSETSHAKLVNAGYDCWNNYDAGNNIASHFYTSIYPVTTVTYDRTSYYVSHPSKNYFDGITSYSHNALINKTNVIGLGSTKSTDRLIDIELIFDLLNMMFKTTNLSGVMYNSSSYSINTDTTNYDVTTGAGINSVLWNLTTCPFGCYYSESDKKLRTKIFGMYNLFDDRMITGLVSNNGHIYTKFTPNTQDGSLGTDFNYQNKIIYYLDSGFLDRGIGYISDYNYHNAGRIPIGSLDGVADFSDNLYCEHYTQKDVDHIPMLCTDDKRHYIKFVSSSSTGHKFGLSIKSKNAV